MTANDPPWPPRVGEPLPRAGEAFSVRYSSRVMDVTTVWQFDQPHAPPRLVTAYIDS